jgi:hypothetical protein
MIGVVVGFGAALVKIAAEDGWVVRPVTLVTAGLPTDKTAVDADAGFELEGGVPVIVNLACAFIGIIRSFRYPELVAFFGFRQGVLQVFVGVFPVAAVAVLVSINIDDASVCNCWH